MIIGGSLGARTINDCIKRNLDIFSKTPYQLIWQTGSYYFEEIKIAVNASDYGNIHIYEFIKKMDLAYAASDVIISRAGALSVSELCIVEKPVILVPSPNVAEDHQTKNAKSLVDKYAAIHVKDVDAGTKLVDIVLELIENKKKCMDLSRNISMLARPDAAKDIVKEIFQIID